MFSSMPFKASALGGIESELLISVMPLFLRLSFTLAIILFAKLLLGIGLLLICTCNASSFPMALL